MLDHLAYFKVSLSILLPFLTAPLVYLTSSKKVMRVVVYRQLPSTESLTPNIIGAKNPQPVTAMTSATGTLNQDSEEQTVEYINMANGLVVTVLGWLIWAFIAGLNVYLIVMLCLGND